MSLTVIWLSGKPHREPCPMKLSEAIKRVESFGANPIKQDDWLETFLNTNLPVVSLLGQTYKHGTALKKISPARFDKLKVDMFEFLQSHGEVVRIGVRLYFVRDLELKARQEGKKLLVFD